MKLRESNIELVCLWILSIPFYADDALLCYDILFWLKILTEAGGVVTDAAGNALDFSKGRYLDLYKGIIVTNQRLMPSLLKAVQEALKQTASSTL